MAGNSFKSEIQDSMSNPVKRPSQVKKESKADKTADTPAEMARDKSKGIVEGSPQDERLDAQQSNSGLHGNSVGGTSPPPHHVAMAASIAHAILGNRGS